MWKFERKKIIDEVIHKKNQPHNDELCQQEPQVPLHLEKQLGPKGATGTGM